MKWVFKVLLALSVSVSINLIAEEKAAPSNYPYQADVFIEGVNVPWGLAQLPDGRFLVSERAGQLFLVSSDGKTRQEVSGLPAIESNGQGGLLDIELAPDYAKSGWIYLSLSSPQGDGAGNNTAIVRGQLKELQLSNVEVIYKGSPNTDSRYHYGSRIEFDRNGDLFFSIGDRGARDQNPQDIQRDGGKIYRVKPDGAIPSDNPFVKEGKPAIYSYGHRNPQGMALNPVTGNIWVHEHGPRGGDEINVIKAGANYGWPVVSYGINYNGTKFTDLTEKEGMTQPAWYWVPSIAPSGMVFVTSDRYPEFKGKVLVGSLKFGYLVLLTVDGDKVIEQEIVFEGIGRTRNVRQLSDGYLYVSVDGVGVKRLVPKK